MNGTAIVEAKCVPPVAPERLVSRPRLEAELVRLVSAHRVVDITATAGSGKTTLVAAATQPLGFPVAWLTLDDTDTAPGRLLTYLEAAVKRALPDISLHAGDALGRGLAHPEAAALLAEATGDRELVLVIDEIERLAEAAGAQAVLSNLIRYAGPGIRFILIGRRRVYLDAMSRIGIGQVGRLDEDGLAFTDEEAAAALRLHGVTEVDVGSIVVSVGGWVAGVLFEAWRSREHIAGSGGEHDPLAGYLAAQILDQLDPAEREFLVLTSVLEEVDRGTAGALGVEAAGEMMARLRNRHLPATWRREGMAMRCHPRFREHLKGLLETGDSARVLEIKHRHAGLLAASGRHEEAVEELLGLGSDEQALAFAEPALRQVIARQDLEVAERWLAQFERAGLGDRPTVLGARLTIATLVEEFGRGVAVADRLLVQAATDGADLDQEQKALAAWCYWHVGRLGDARALLDGDPESLGATIRCLFSLVDDEPPRQLPVPGGGPLDAIVLRIAFVRGRLREVRDAPVSIWTPATTERVAALRALGELHLTEELLGADRPRLSNLRVEGTVRTELLIDVGDEQGAREALARGRERIAGSGSFVFDMILRLLEAKLELRLGRDPTTALAVLEETASAGPLCEYGYLAEQLDLWSGYARLLQGRDGEAAELLAAAVARMQVADRILELPAAASYLAEARWRLGDEAGADSAANAALAAADRLGSRHLLLIALRDVPGVLARQTDAEETPDGTWHELSDSLTTFERAGRASPGARVELHDLGPPFLLVDGGERRARLSKSYALLAYLIEAGGMAPRAALLEALFDGHSNESASAYLRQAAHGLRLLLPTELAVRSVDGNLELGEPEAFTSRSAKLVAELAHVVELNGRDRIEAAEAALRRFGGGYMEGVDCDWVDERRRELEALALGTRIALALAAFEECRFDLAERTLKQVVAEDALQERPWRLLMRVAAARGSEKGVIEAYQGCERALSDAGLTPSQTTRRLLVDLRP